MAYDKDDENEKDEAKEARTKVVLATAASRSEGRQARGAGKQVDKLGEQASRRAGEHAGEEGEQANRQGRKGNRRIGRQGRGTGEQAGEEGEQASRQGRKAQRGQWPRCLGHIHAAGSACPSPPLLSLLPFSFASFPHGCSELDDIYIYLSI